MIKISERTKRNIEKAVGLSYDEITRLDYDEEMLYLEKNGKIIKFPKHIDNRKRSRGNPLLSLNRIRSIIYIDKRLKKIK